MLLWYPPVLSTRPRGCASDGGTKTGLSVTDASETRAAHRDASMGALRLAEHARQDAVADRRLVGRARRVRVTETRAQALERRARSWWSPQSVSSTSS